MGTGIEVGVARCVGGVRLRGRGGRCLGGIPRSVVSWLCRPALQGLQDAGLDSGIFQHGQLVQGLQPQVVEKLAGGREQGGTADGLAVPDHFHPAPVLELLEDQAVDGHAADLFDIATGDGLPVGDDGQRLEGGAGIARGLLGMEPVQVFAHLGPALEPPARGHLHELDAALGPLLLQLHQQPLDGVGAQRILKERAQLPQHRGLRRTDQRGFEDPFGIHRIHGSAMAVGGAAGRGAPHEVGRLQRLAELCWPAMQAMPDWDTAREGCGREGSDTVLSAALVAGVGRGSGGHSIGTARRAAGPDEAGRPEGRVQAGL